MIQSHAFAAPNLPFSNLPSSSLDNPMAGPSAPFYARSMASTSQTANPSFLLPNQPGDFPSPFPSSVDPAQFIWAVSSRLPTVEESSPHDEQRSTLSGPSPTVLDPNTRTKRPLRKAATSKEKIVKVTWWRPHGQTAIAPGEYP